MDVHPCTGLAKTHPIINLYRHTYTQQFWLLGAEIWSYIAVSHSYYTTPSTGLLLSRHYVSRYTDMLPPDPGTWPPKALNKRSWHYNTAQCFAQASINVKPVCSISALTYNSSKLYVWLTNGTKPRIPYPLITMHMGSIHYGAVMYVWCWLAKADIANHSLACLAFMWVTHWHHFVYKHPPTGRSRDWTGSNNDLATEMKFWHSWVKRCCRHWLHCHWWS